MAREAMITMKQGRVVNRSRPVTIQRSTPENEVRRAVRIDRNTIVLTKHINQTDEQVRTDFKSACERSIQAKIEQSIAGARNKYDRKPDKNSLGLFEIREKPDAKRGRRAVSNLETGGEGMGLESERLFDFDDNGDQWQEAMGKISINELI